MIRSLIILLLIVGCDTKVCDFFLGNICESDESEVSADTEAVEGACPDKFCFPLDNYVVSQDFRSQNESPLGMFHTAEDAYDAAGTPVYAIYDGFISYSATGYAGGYGGLIVIDHSDPNIYSLYGHTSLSRWYKKSGHVKKGELIGYLGDSDEICGYISGWEDYVECDPHIHFGIRDGHKGDYCSGTYGDPCEGDGPLGARDNRWAAGYTTVDPLTLGWHDPSNFINEQNQTNPL